MKFEIEQIALCPKDPEAARALLCDMEHRQWYDDHVRGSALIEGDVGTSEADLRFNYSALARANELEILNYTFGKNWMEKSQPRISHLGMHCGEEALERWRDFFSQRGINVAQEMITDSHTNPTIAGKRTYHYVIFDTYDILSVDLKFIVRHDISDI